MKSVEKCVLHLHRGLWPFLCISIKTVRSPWAAPSEPVKLLFSTSRLNTCPHPNILISWGVRRSERCGNEICCNDKSITSASRLLFSLRAHSESVSSPRLSLVQRRWVSVKYFVIKKSQMSSDSSTTMRKITESCFLKDSQRSLWLWPIWWFVLYIKASGNAPRRWCLVKIQRVV